MSTHPPAPQHGPFVLFDLAVSTTSELPTFALDVANVEEVLEIEGLKPVPLSPSIVLGMISHRGRIVTVIDPAPLLGLGPQGSPLTQAALLRQPGPSEWGGLALSVGRVGNILESERVEEEKKTPEPCIAWVGMSERQTIKVIELTALLESILSRFPTTRVGDPRQGAHA